MQSDLASTDTHCETACIGCTTAGVDCCVAAPMETSGGLEEMSTSALSAILSTTASNVGRGQMLR